MTRITIAATLVVVLLALCDNTAARAQGWAVDVSAGRFVYDPVSADVGTSNLLGSLRYDSRLGIWVYGAGAIPAGSDGTFWGAAGTGGRVMFFVPQGGGGSLGADVGAHAFSFRDRVVDQAGTGGTLEALTFARLALGGSGFIEGHGGWRGQTLSFAGIRENRQVFETGARGGYGGALRIEGDARWVYASEGMYPFVGATVTYTGPRVDVWGQTGKWLAADLDQRVWSLGSGVNLGVRTSVWGSVRQEAPDPLYWNSSRRTWTIARCWTI